MIPNKVYINGFKRFNEASVLLDRKLLAFVGANEAGKSSFFEALLSIETKTPYDLFQLTKGLKLDNKPEHIVVEVEYMLEDQDKCKIKEFYGEGAPQYYYLQKKVNGSIIDGFRGGSSIKRDLNDKFKLLKIISEFETLKSFNRFLDKNYYLDEEDSQFDYSQTLRNLLISFKEQLEEDNVFDIGEKILLLFEKKLKYENDSIKIKKNKIIEHISSLSNILKKEHPLDRFLEYCQLKRPKFVLFENNDRILKGRYTLNELANPTAALLNLLTVAKIEVSEFLNAINRNDDDERLRLQEIANKNLKKQYSTWSQSRVYPSLLLDKDSLSIKIKLPNEAFIGIEYRSDGFKQYIALKAFLNTKSYELPVLLIDEAEIHLHYAAQADLIKEFEQQDYVNSIIYTTHSAGCLPSDLGSGIRVIEQIFDKKADTGESKIRNSIWRNDAGFSPILFAMGANIISFTLARKALLAEGASETILLPRLFRDAYNLENLDFQIAPGIAEIPKNKIKDLKLEAAMVSYIVDGDKGGENIKKRLIKNGIEENNIVSLDNECTLEDYVNPNILLKSINRELKRINDGKIEINIDQIPKNNRISFFKDICKNLKYEYPSKVRIAENIVKYSSTEKIIDKNKRDNLKKKYEDVCRLLDITIL